VSHSAVDWARVGRHTREELAWTRDFLAVLSIVAIGFLVVFALVLPLEPALAESPPEIAAHYSLELILLGGIYFVLVFGLLVATQVRRALELPKRPPVSTRPLDTPLLLTTNFVLAIIRGSGLVLIVVILQLLVSSVDFGPALFDPLVRLLDLLELIFVEHRVILLLMGASFILETFESWRIVLEWWRNKHREMREHVRHAFLPVVDVDVSLHLEGYNDSLSSKGYDMSLGGTSVLTTDPLPESPFQGVLHLAIPEEALNAGSDYDSVVRYRCMAIHSRAVPNRVGFSHECNAAFPSRVVRRRCEARIGHLKRAGILE